MAQMIRSFRIILWCISALSICFYITAALTESSINHRIIPRTQCLTCNPHQDFPYQILNQLSQISFFTKINFAVDICIFVITTFNLVKSDQSGAGDFLISIGVFCKIYLIPYVLYNFFSGGQSPAHNINYLLHHEICGTLGNCLNGNVARILFSCISVTLIMILAFPALIASWGVMYIIFVRYFDQPLPMVTEYVDDLPTYSALFPDIEHPLFIKKDDDY
ncbi:Protein CBG11043 [Caenorhabditis briggsae]|uniref:Uncharacterized protein n=2 Tax=Caenorhabditis briggsae TaxID=6238 RepID=A0AAE8ZSH2_CAEBR|nr:Protein CBG11043 [Caenorhabditis briggsae]ULT83085.1 hypothetical protein L3Y34_012375 [Caenorhabditis briggsae]UMM42384.1 hypothetical protein L5515_018231 [Caenorhabditis briggsae]CAP30270.2 Protein CBG11043 [Caenorhabditis briggsae]